MLAQNGHSSNPQDVQAFHQLQPCPYCGALIRWMRHRTTGKVAAIDLAHTHFGLVLINITRGTYEELTPDEKRIHGGWLHALHSNICPNVDKWYQGR